MRWPAPASADGASRPGGGLPRRQVPGRRRRAPAAVLAVLAAALPAGAFVDPLDAPATPSALAARRPIAAVTTAGTRLVAVGQRGHVLWSDDGGRRWTQAAVPVSTDLTAVHFTSAERGWACGHDGVVLATRDGGRSWVKQLDGRELERLLRAWVRDHEGDERREALEQAAWLAGRGADQPLLDIWFADERSGFAVGAFDLVLRTADGGATWTPWPGRTDNPRGLHLYAVRRVAGAVIAVGEQGLVLRLDAAGERFRAAPAPYRGSLFGLVGDGAVAIAYGLRGTALRSADGGVSWREIPTGLEVALTGGVALPDGRLVLVSQAGDLLVSADGGRSFGRVRRERASPAAAVAPAGAGEVVIAGADGLRVERVDRDDRRP